MDKVYFQVGATKHYLNLFTILVGDSAIARKGTSWKWTKFNTFEFNGLTYRYQMSRINDGIVKKPDGTRVTDLERTIIDSINDFEKIGGLEELLRSLEMMPYIDETKLLCYLKSYDKQVLFQKTRYILEHFKDSLKITDMFF